MDKHKINIGPSDGGTIVPLTHRPTVLRILKIVGFQAKNFLDRFE